MRELDRVMLRYKYTYHISMTQNTAPALEAESDWRGDCRNNTAGRPISSLFVL
jgi:hypothetical protein